MDVYTTHGAFSWSELMTTDPTSATEFYGTLFGWSFEPMSMAEGTYHVVKAAGASIGGIMGTPAGSAGMPSMWGCYVTVDDVDATAKRCSELGGKVLVGPQDIPEVGRFAVIQDRQGAALNIITYAPRAA